MLQMFNELCWAAAAHTIPIFLFEVACFWHCTGGGSVDDEPCDAFFSATAGAAAENAPGHLSLYRAVASSTKQRSNNSRKGYFQL